MSKKTECARWTSIMKKLENDIKKIEDDYKNNVKDRNVKDRKKK